MEQQQVADFYCCFSLELNVLLVSLKEKNWVLCKKHNYPSNEDKTLMGYSVQ